MDNLVRRPPSSLLSPQVASGRYFFLRPGSSRIAFGGHEVCRGDYRLVRSGYPYQVVEYIVSGQGTLTHRGRAVPVGPGSVFAYRPGDPVVLESVPDAPFTKYFATLHPSFSSARLRRAGLEPGRPARIPAHAELQSPWEDLIREGRGAGPAAGRLAEALLEVLLLKVEDLGRRTRAGEDLARTTFARCRALVDARVAELSGLADIARACSLEASSVCRLFRRFQGTSPHRYLLRAKMNLAAEHLLAGGCLVKEAAAKVGFEDPYHFSRRFKAVHGVAPTVLAHARSPAVSPGRRDR